jgi:hypothetical protein
LWEKSYPAYFGTYDPFGEIRKHVDRYGNLFLIGRHGMHRYNNQDHSMLTAMMAVDRVIDGNTDKVAALRGHVVTFLAGIVDMLKGRTSLTP